MDNGNIRDFIKNQNRQGGNGEKAEPQKRAGTQGAPKQGGTASASDAQKKAENTAKRYAGMNEAQLMKEMQKAAAQGKQNGALTAQSLEEFYSKAAPMLTVQQRNKLRSLINGLK